MSGAYEAPWRVRLQAKIDESGKTRSLICREAGVNPAFLTQLLGKKGATPKIDSLHKVAVALGTSVSYIVDGIDGDAATLQLLAELRGVNPADVAALIELARAT